jgi:hypothetical protein
LGRRLVGRQRNPLYLARHRVPSAATRVHRPTSRRNGSGDISKTMKFQALIQTRLPRAYCDQCGVKTTLAP